MLEERFLQETVLILRGSMHRSLVKKLFEVAKRYQRLQKQALTMAPDGELNQKGEAIRVLQVFIDYCNQLSRLQKASGERYKWRCALGKDFKVFEDFASYLGSI
jgi:hypothetical protein